MVRIYREICLLKMLKVRAKPIIKKKQQRIQIHIKCDQKQRKKEKKKRNRTIRYEGKMLEKPFEVYGEKRKIN